jgi:hypothetical protein
MQFILVPTTVIVETLLPELAAATEQFVQFASSKLTAIFKYFR